MRWACTPQRCLGAATLLLVCMVATACSTTLRRFPDAPPLLVDPDRQPFSPQPSEYVSGLIADGLDQSLLRPMADFFAVDPGREARNVNSLDEVPNSSWFTNRVGTPEIDDLDRFAAGPCYGKKPLDASSAPWLVTGAKPNGENPGFLVKTADGRRFLFKFDGLKQQPRATAADVVVSRLYYAAGYETPCNRIIHFDRKVLKISPKATVGGEPLAEHHLDEVFRKALQLPDGRYRANASLFLKGKPLGPFRYEGTRDDDPNDVIDHEDRRDLRGAMVLASWTNHFDSREQNSLDMWVETSPGKGYIQHHTIDFGDCFGSLWEWDALSRRWGHSYVFSFDHILGDFLTFGFFVRPWDKAKYGVAGEVFAYFGREPFHPDAWYNEYPNPAFSRATERDAAWMARIVAYFSDDHIRRAIDSARFYKPAVTKELERILIYRRDKLLRRWFSKLSPLSHPTVVNSDGGAKVCLKDLAAMRSLAPPRRLYGARTWQGLELSPVPSGPVVAAPDHRVCVSLPKAVSPQGQADPVYVIVDVELTAEPDAKIGPARVHLYRHAGGRYTFAGLERPTKEDASDLYR